MNGLTASIPPTGAPIGSEMSCRLERGASLTICAGIAPVMRRDGTLIRGDFPSPIGQQAPEERLVRLDRLTLMASKAYYENVNATTPL